MSRIITGVTSRSWLKLAGVVGYAIVLVVSLFGPPALRAQSSPSVTPVASSLSVKPGSLNFGFQISLPPRGVAGKPQNITLSVAKNQPQPVTIESLLISDQNAPPGQFIIQSNNCGVIAPGASCAVPIVFQPSGLKRRSAVLLITSNASTDNGIQSVSLVGFGRQGSLSINPGSLSFPAAAAGATPGASKPVTLSNRNAVPLTLSNISSSNQDVFQLSNNCPTTLQPSAQCTFSVTFVPDRNGGISGRVSISDNAAGPNRVSLSGGGRGFPTPTRTSTPTRTATPSPTKDPGPFPMRAFPVMH